jgi:ParB-like chromosome segregation protein Spo0J
MRIIDGMHRLRVAQLRGDVEIQVEYFDGTELEAFIRAVQLNVTHGLPLALADREAAAARIIEWSDNFSDRAIAEMTGLSAPTVARIRAHSPEDRPPASQVRLGRDGRVRPLSTVAGRQRASELIGTEPNLSLREVARRAGISVGTARDVRKRLSRGEDPIPARFSDRSGAGFTARPGRQSQSGASATDTGDHLIDGSYTSILMSLQKDPSLRLTDNGRFLLRWFSLHVVAGEQRANFIKSMPTHNRNRIAYMAKCCSRWWEEFARDLERQDEHRDMPGNG